MALKLTNPERLVYETMRFTKRDVVEYYRAVAPFLVPHLKEHPVTLKRYPDTTNGLSFWEKDAPAFTPKWVKTFPVWRRTGESQIRYIVVDSARALEWAASVGTLEFHPFLARVPEIDQPTAVVFDLDPGEGLNVVGAATVALMLRETLARLGLESVAKVSGVKGVQVYVPLNTPAAYAVTQAFAKTVAELLHNDHPELIVAEMAKSERKGRVFIDWSQNADYKTTIAVYSLRAKRHRPHVSLPVSWDELREAVEADDSSRLYWLAPAALERLARVGDLFAPVLTLRQTLPQEFTRALGGMSAKSASARTAPKAVRTAAMTRAAEQGGRRRFRLLVDGKADVLALEFGEEGEPSLAFEISGEIPRRTRERVSAKRTNVAKGAASQVADEGTFELVEGSVGKGYLYLFFSGKQIKGEYTAVREEAEDWTLTRGFVAMRGAAVAGEKTGKVRRVA